MPGFQNDTLFAGNVDFTGNVTYPTPQVTADGQLLIGAAIAPNIRVGTLTSLDSSVTITPTAGSIDLSAASVPPVNEDQIYYVAKSGNDLNSGRTIAQAFLTFGAAITAATAMIPTAANRFVIWCFDDGIYTEDVVGVPYVDIFAPNATLVATTTGLTVADNSNYTILAMQVPDGSFGVLKTSLDVATSCG